MGVCSLEDVLFPGMAVRLDEVVFTAEVLVVSAVACGPPPRCPGCRSRARRVHSTYERGLAERPLTGKKLQVKLRVRRFFCDRSSCRRKTFVEQVDGLSELPALQPRHAPVVAGRRRRTRRTRW
ncbi:transposase [Streptomyces sp. AcE210]|nr:transposase [Streptomyces sp. AcE210]